jgi:aspartate/methionine/tyrosine aminotransferase
MAATTTTRTARRTHGFTESVIREMTRVASQTGAINLAQGFPDFAAPEILKEAACAAIRENVNQYAVTWGTPRLRRAIASKYARHYGLEIDEAREVTVTCGATEAMAATLLAVIDPGDEVIVFEPFYENYGPDTILCDASPVWVPMPTAAAPLGRGALDVVSPDSARDGGELDLDRLAAAFSERTRAIVINSPNNPTGRVFSAEELAAIAELCVRYDAIAITDEIYEHILYDGRRHVPMATLPGMRDRTITISGFSKTFSITGWRVGTIVAPPDITAAIRKVHDFLTVGAPAPLQEACAAGLELLGDEYYQSLALEYRERRDVLCAALLDVGFRCSPPQGAYYVLADFSELSELDDVAFAHHLARGGHALADAPAGGGGVATVPGSSFFHDSRLGRGLVRFAFCKQIDTLHQAAARLREARSRL